MSELQTFDNVDPHPPEWHERRRQGIGGSDWGDILNLEPYGCRRKAVYQKRGTEPDFPREYTGAMQRGHAMEPIIADLAEQATGRKARAVRLFDAERRGLPSWWLGELDRVLQSVPAGEVDAAGNPGTGRPSVLECKSRSEWVFRALQKRGEPTLAEVAQVMHYIALAGYDDGVLASHEPISWRLRLDRIVRDDALIESMLKAGETFVREVEHGPMPDRLDAGDKRCRSCPFRLTCHGEALFDAAPKAEPGELHVVDDFDLATMIDELREATPLLEQAQELVDGVKQRIRDHLGDAPTKVEVLGTGARVYILQKSAAQRVDTKRLKAELPEIAERYTVAGAVPKPELRLYGV